MNKQYHQIPHVKWQLYLYFALFILHLPLLYVWQYPALFLSGQFFSPFFLAVSAVSVVLFSGMAFFLNRQFRHQQTWQVELTEEQISWTLNSRKGAIPLAQIERCDLNCRPDGKLISISLWGVGQRILLFNYQNIADLAAELTQRTPAGVVTQRKSYFHMNQITSQFVMLSYIFILSLFNFAGHTPFIFLGIPLYCAGMFAFFQPIRDTLNSKNRWWDIGLAFVFLAGFIGYFYLNYAELKANYWTHPCDWLPSLREETGCLASFNSGARSQIVFSSDSQTMVYEFRYGPFMRAETGVIIQPLGGWFTHFRAKFIPVGENSFFNTESWFALSRRLDITSGGSYVVSDDWYTHQTVVEPILAEGERRFFFDEGDEPILRWFSPTGRYFVTLEDGSDYWVYTTADGTHHQLPVEPDTAVFSAAETELFMLTENELLAWDITSQTGRTLAPRPGEWAGLDAGCLRQTGEGQFLLVLDSFNLWWWEVNTGQTQLLLNSALPSNCRFFTGADWLFFHNQYEEKLLLFDLPVGQLRWEKEDWGMRNWAVSPDGRYLAGSDRDYTYLFDFELLRQQP